MLNKKKAKPEKTPEQQALEEQVDAMMDPRLPDKPPTEPAEPVITKETAVKAVKSAVKPAATATKAKTAPALSAKLREQIGADDAAAKPLSIDKLDELTQSITEDKASAESKTSAKSKTPAADKEPDDPEAPDEPESPKTDIPESTELDDAQTDKAVDEIVAYEGDVMLAVADSTAAARNRQAAGDSAQESSRGTFSVILWTFVILMVIVAIVFFGFLLTGGNTPNLPHMPKL